MRGNSLVVLGAAALFGSSAMAQGSAQRPLKVNVTNEPTVSVVNSALDPLSVVDVGGPSSVERVQAREFVFIGPGSESSTGFGVEVYAVPTGKRLVIETISVSAIDGSGVNYFVELIGSDSARLSFYMQTTGSFGTLSGGVPLEGVGALTTSATLIVNSEDSLQFQCFRDDTSFTDEGRCIVQIVGFLEDAP